MRQLSLLLRSGIPIGWYIMLRFRGCTHSYRLAASETSCRSK